MSTPTSMTRLLAAARAGDRAATDRLFARVYDELHRLAHFVRGSGTPDSLNTTALLHEAYLHLRPDEGLDVNDRRHLLQVAARAMRQVLAREARRRKAWKRGGRAVTVSFQDGTVGRTVALSDILTLEEALSTLDRLRPRQARVVECRFYAGLSVEETAETLEISTATVKRDWRAARAWLLTRLKEGTGGR